MTETPPSLPLVGHTVRFARDPFGFVADALDEYGRDGLVKLDLLGIGDLYVLARPRHLERALVRERDAFDKGPEFARAFGNAVIAVEGDDWREQRGLLDSFFDQERVRSYVETMRTQIDRRVSRWTPGEAMSLAAEMKSLTLDVLFATVLGRELDVDGDEDLRRAADGLNGRFAPTSWVLPEWVPTPSRRRFDRSVETLRSEVRRLVADAADESLTGALGTARDDEGYPRSREALENQLVGMVFAGHETTALALTFTCYLLATHPSVAERLTAKIDAVVGDGPVEFERLHDLSFLDRVLKESLRLYPPVHTLPRRTTRPVEFDGTRIPADADVHLSVIRVHRDGELYDDPMAFRPDRWTPAFESSLPPYAHVPFGSGPRSCLGRAFALTEAKVALARIVREFSFEWVGDDLEIYPEMTTQPRGETLVVPRSR